MYKNIIITLLGVLATALGFISTRNAEIKPQFYNCRLSYHSFADSFYVTIQLKSPDKEYDLLQVFCEITAHGKIIAKSSATLRNSRSVATCISITDIDSTIRKDPTAVFTYWGIGRDGLFKSYYLLRPSSVTILNHCSARSMAVQKSKQVSFPEKPILGEAP